MRLNSATIIMVLLGLISDLSMARKATIFNMKEYESIDTEVHNYDTIMNEDIWKYQVAQKIGVQSLTPELYMEKVFTQKKGDKPWYICIINFSPKFQNYHMTFLMKSLYFLQRDFSDKANYATVDAQNEMIREAFDYEIIPQCVYVKDGKPYYSGWDVLGINVIQEFMIRHEEISKEAMPYLQSAPSEVTIYLQYHLRSIGVWLNSIEKWLAIQGKQNWIHYFNDENLEYYPHTMIGSFAKLCFEPFAKTAALNFLKIFVLPLLAFLVLVARLGCCNILCCCCARSSNKNTAEGADELLMDQEVEEPKKDT